MAGPETDAGRGALQASGTRMGHVKLQPVAVMDARVRSTFVKQAVKLNRLKGDPTRIR